MAQMLHISKFHTPLTFNGFGRGVHLRVSVCNLRPLKL